MNSNRNHPTKGGADNTAPIPENMYFDREGRLRRMPGYRRVRLPRGRVYSISTVGEHLLVHLDGGLYSLPLGSTDSTPSKIISLAHSESRCFSFGKICFVTDGEGLWQIDQHLHASLISRDPHLCGCSCAQIFDGRLFLSGNTDLPGVIFYSTPITEGNVTFTGENRLTEGTGLVNIVTLLSIGGYLWIFKAEDDGCGGIICRRAGDGYPVARVLSHTGLCYGAGSINGTPLFIGEGGLMTIREPMNEGKVAIESLSPIAPGIEPKDCRILVWLCRPLISVCKKIYLLDMTGRRCSFISPVCGYKNDRYVYRYAPTAEDNLLIHRHTDGIARGEIYSYTGADGKRIFYSLEGDRRYAVYPTHEKHLGEEVAPTHTICIGDRIYFATEGGVYLFNSITADGKAPDADSEDYYAHAGHRVIHRAPDNKKKERKNS
ncbi:MAG: hypothetical protein J6V80_00740 [Clostridia bacterium]|nr:hypothetical protein [Clostridia bacterium]